MATQYCRQLSICLPENIYFLMNEIEAGHHSNWKIRIWNSDL